MTDKAAKFLIIFAVLMLLAALSPVMLSQARADAESPGLHLQFGNPSGSTKTIMGLQIA